jgi:hypothetical protein
MAPSKVIMIVPRLPPAIDGLGDYALSLAEVMRGDYSIDTQFVVGDPRWQGPRSINGYSVDRVDCRSKTGLLKVFGRISDGQAGNITIFLNLAIYGYARWGTPFWLVEILEFWKAFAPNVLIVTMFHELSNAPGWPWQHMFWTANLQKQILRRLLSVSDIAVTSNATYADSLSRLGKGSVTDIKIMPVPSTMGEDRHPKPLNKRKKRLIVFGQCGGRIKAYRNARSQLSQVCADLGIEEIWDIGPQTDLPYKSIGKIHIQELGEKSAVEVGEIMADSMVGLLHYESNLLLKSSIFASYCARGMLAVLSCSDFRQTDELAPDQHYYSPGHTQVASMTLEIAQEIARKAHEWYFQHDLKAQGDFFTTILTTPQNLQSLLNISESSYH